MKTLINILPVLALALPSLSYGYCFQGDEGRGSQQLQQIAFTAANVSKQIKLNGTAYSVPLGPIKPGRIADIKNFSAWLTKELNSDSLLTQQILPAINQNVIQNGRASSYIETYVNGDGVVCLRVPFEAQDLSIESVTVKGETVKAREGEDRKLPVKTYEVIFKVHIKAPSKYDDYGPDERFSLKVEATRYPTGQDFLLVTSYPQFLGEAKN